MNITFLMTKKYFENVFYRINKLFILGIYLLLFFFVLSCIYRCIFISIYSVQPIEYQDLFNLLLRVIPLDFHSITEFLFPIKLLLSITSFVVKEGIANFLAKTFLVLLFIYAIFSFVANIYYYKTFNSIIDIFFFNFLDEDGKALTKTVLSDYPVIKFTIFLTIATFVYYKFLNLLLKRTEIINKCSFFQSIILLPVLMLAFIFSYNGQIGFNKLPNARPRSAVFSSVSSNKVINDSISNPMTLITWMRKEYHDSNKLKTHDIDYRELKELCDYFMLKYDPKNPLSSFTAETKHNEYLEQNKPNVVVVYEESFSGHFALFDNKNNFDLLGGLRQSLNNDFYFKNFICEENSTHESVVKFTLKFPNKQICNHRKLANLAYDTFFFKPYKDAGYKTVFIFGSDVKWGNLDKIFKANGMDELYGGSDIKELYPEAKTYTWGIADEYVLNFAKNRLEKANRCNENVAIFVLTTINHTPYDFPREKYSKDFNKLTWPKALFKEIYNLTEDETKRHIETFKYASMSLGNFISDIKQSTTLADNTVIAYTGDHNTRISYCNDPKFAIKSKNVVTAIYLPKKLQDNIPNLSYNKNTVCSNKDLMVTLYENTLSRASYIKLGCNLLTKEDCPFNFAYNKKVSIDNDFKTTLEPDNQVINRKSQNYTKLVNWLFNYEITNKDNLSR